MPCYDPFPDPSIELLHERTDQLCRVLDILEADFDGNYALLPRDVLEWHKKHKAFDEDRKK